MNDYILHMYLHLICVCFLGIGTAIAAVVFPGILSGAGAVPPPAPPAQAPPPQPPAQPNAQTQTMNLAMQMSGASITFTLSKIIFYFLM